MQWCWTTSTEEQQYKK